jgi:hypothetical protein
MKNILPIALTLLITLLGVSAVDAQVPYQPQTYYVANLSATRGEDCGAYYSVTPMPAAPKGQPQVYYIANLSSTDGADCSEYVTVTPQSQITYPTPVIQNLASPLFPVQSSELSLGVDGSMSEGESDPEH